MYDTDVINHISHINQIYFSKLMNVTFCIRFLPPQLLNLCEAEDAALMKLPCYKSLPSLVPLRIAALSEWALLNLILVPCIAGIFQMLHVFFVQSKLICTKLKT